MKKEYQSPEMNVVFFETENTVMNDFSMTIPDPVGGGAAGLSAADIYGEEEE